MPFTLELILGHPAAELGLTVTTFEIGAIDGDEERPGSYPVACCSGWQLDPTHETHEACHTTHCFL
jgi:hypothetical protein